MVGIWEAYVQRWTIQAVEVEMFGIWRLQPLARSYKKRIHKYLRQVTVGRYLLLLKLYI